MANSKFQKGTGAYKCIECGKLTRETGEGESQAQLCLNCWEEGGLINEHSDGYHIEYNENCPDCREEKQAKDDGSAATALKTLLVDMLELTHKIETAIDENMICTLHAPEMTDWEEVAAVKSIKAKLQEVSDMMNGEGDYGLLDMEDPCGGNAESGPLPYKMDYTDIERQDHERGARGEQ